MSPDLDDLDVERALRDHLARRAGSVDPSLAPVALVTRRARSRERRQVLVAAVAVAAVTLGGTAVAAPWLTGSTQGQVATDPGPDGRWAPDEVPTRGDLADDDAFRARAQRAARETYAAVAAAAAAAGRPTGDLTAPVLGHVVFAGRLPAGAAVVATVKGLPDQLVTFWSPTGRVADLTLQRAVDRSISDGVPVDQVAVSVGSPGGPGYAVVVPLLASTSSVEVSSGPVVGTDGSVRRTWSLLPLADGVAVGRLDAANPIQVPLVRLDGGRARVVTPAVSPNTPEQEAAFVREAARTWGIGTAPAEATVSGALGEILRVVPVGRMSVEPVFHGREQPSTAEVVAGLVRLDDGAVLQVAGAFDDRVGRTPTLTTLIAGRPVPARAAVRTPFTWVDDVSYSQSGTEDPTMRARARLALPGAARMEVRDVGAVPCGAGRTYGSADVDANGLGTVVVDIPSACLDADPADVARTDIYRSIVAVALDARGREIGRASIQPASPSEVVDTPDYALAVSPAGSAGAGG